MIKCLTIIQIELEFRNVGEAEAEAFYETLRLIKA